MLRFAVCLVACTVLAAVTSHAGKLIPVAIVIPKSPLPVVTLAAKELQGYVRKASGVVPRIATEGSIPSGC